MLHVSISDIRNNSFVGITSNVNANSNRKLKAAVFDGLISDAAADINRVSEANNELTYENAFGNAAEFASEFSR